MLIDIFSLLDIFEFNGIGYISANINMTLRLIFILFIYSGIWVNKNKLNITSLTPKLIIYKQLNSTRITKISGLIGFVTSNFTILILVNIIGITPKSFSIRSHLIFTVVIGLPIWITIIYSRIINNKK